MGLLYQIFIDPFVQMGTAPDLFVQTLWEGMVGGVLYALIALGFVLIFKASGVFNFAQGIMVVFAALTLVGLYNAGVPAFLALGLTIAVMFALAFAVERAVLRPLVNQPDIILFMATFGLTYFLIGFGEFVFGGEPKVMITEQLYLPKGTITYKALGGIISLQKLDIAAAVIASVMVAGARGLLLEDTHWARAARGCRQPFGGAFRRYFARADLGDRVVCGGPGGAGDRHHVGRALGRFLRPRCHRAQGAAGAYPRRADIHSWRYRRRSDHRHRREAVGILLGPADRRRHRCVVRFCASRWCSCCSGRRACSANASSSGCRAHALPRGRAVQDHLRQRSGDLPDSAGPHRHRSSFLQSRLS